MAAILEKRRSLHKHITSSQQKNELLQSQLAHLQALANIGTVASMIAHEMNNILTPLTNYAQLALNNPTDTALIRKTLEKTILNSARAAKILESITTLANGEKQHKTHSRLNEPTSEQRLLADTFSTVSLVHGRCFFGNVERLADLARP
jgi:signal transduction histidine kinase